MAIWTRLRVVAHHFRRCSSSYASCVRSWRCMTLIYSCNSLLPRPPPSAASSSAQFSAEVCCLWKLVANLGCHHYRVLCKHLFDSTRSCLGNWEKSPEIRPRSTGERHFGGLRLRRDVHINEFAPSGDRWSDMINMMVSCGRFSTGGG